MASALTAYLDQERRRPFEWGRRNGDCLLFVAGWVGTARGGDPAAAWRGSYGSEAEARALLESLGGTWGVIAAELGEPAAIGARPSPGDVGIYHGRNGLSAVICLGRTWAGRVPGAGLWQGPLAVSAHWAVGWAG